MYRSELVEPLVLGLSRLGDGELLRDSRGVSSGRQLVERSGERAHALFRAGLRHGDRLLVALPPGRPFAELLLAALRLGCPLVPLSPTATPRQWDHACYETGPRLIIAPRAAAPRAGERTRSARWLEPDELSLHGREGDDDTASEMPLTFANMTVESPPTHPALILFTSGSTGAPKGVVHTHASLRASVAALQEAWRLGPDDRLLLTLPWYHLHGLVVGLLASLWSQTRVEILERFDAAEVHATLRLRPATLFYGVPTMYHRLARHEPAALPESLRLLVCGSAALTSAAQRELERQLGRPLRQRYGTTETSIALSEAIDAPAAGAAGRPLPGVEVRIVDEEGRDGPRGELWIRSPAIFAGYFEDPEKTQGSFADGHYRTGDLVERDADGNLRVLGRLQHDVLKVRGHKVGAGEIEAVLAEVAAVSECAVVGIPDDEDGDLVVACIRWAEGTDQDLRDPSLRRHATENLPAHQVPRHILGFDEFPLVGPGKVDKQALRAAVTRRLRPPRSRREDPPCPPEAAP